MVFLSEVRCSTEQQISVSRRAKALMYHIIFSPPPPPSPNFKTSPGGTAIAVKIPYSIRAVDPLPLARWVDMGRVVTGRLISTDACFLLVCVYGIPVGHPQKQANDLLVSDVLAWTQTLNMPLLLAGDINETPYSIPTMTALHVWGFFRLNTSEPTTKGRNSRVSKGFALDHVICNSRMLDFCPTARLACDKALSDHFPLDGSFQIPALDFGVQHWPAPMDLSWGQVLNPPWTGSSTTLAAWNERAVSWLSLAFLVPRVPKNLSYVSPFVVPTAKCDQHARAIQAAKKALDHVRTCRKPSAPQIRALKRKLLALNINDLSWDRADEELDRLTKDAIETSFSHAIKKWRDRTRFWTIQSKELFAFLKNNPPEKAAAMETSH